MGNAIGENNWKGDFLRERKKVLNRRGDYGGQSFSSRVEEETEAIHALIEDDDNNELIMKYWCYVQGSVKGVIFSQKKKSLDADVDADADADADAR